MMTLSDTHEIIFTHLQELQPFMEEPTVTEINVNWDGSIYVERQGQREVVSGVRITAKNYSFGIQQMAQALKGTSLNAQKPRLHATLPDGSRVAIAIPPMSYGGITLTIRKHRGRAYSLPELVDSGTLPPVVLAVLAPAIQRAENPASIAISGPTGSGKTTLLNGLLTLIDPATRVGFIEEDAAEIKKEHFADLFPFVTTETIHVRALVKDALRHTPERLIVGEVRGAEAIDMVDALNTGHPGSFTTLHANSAEHALRRLRTFMLNAEGTTPQNYQAVGYQIADAFQFVVHMGRVKLPHGERKRAVTELIRVTGYHPEKDQFLTETLYPLPVH